MRALSWAGIIAGLVVLGSCGGRDSTWSDEWAEIRSASTFPDFCDMELCDDIEQGYEPVCDCWCDYDGGEDEGDGGDGGGGGEDSCDGNDDVPGDCDDGGGGGGDDGGGGGGDEGGGDDGGGGGGDEGGGDDGGGDDGGGCTLTQGYWKNHNEFQTNNNQAVDWPAPYDERDEMCGQTLLDILNTPSGGEAWLILAHQFIAASLNAATGADDSGIDAELARAGDLLLAGCGGIGAADRAEAIELSELLDAYNNGHIGPGHCN